MKTKLITDKNELLIVNAARASFGKQHSSLTESDIRLMKYLYKHDHWTPFAHVQIPAMICFSDEQAINWLAEQPQGVRIVTYFRSFENPQGVTTGGAYVYMHVVGSLWFWLDVLGKMPEERIEQPLDYLEEHLPNVMDIVREEDPLDIWYVPEHVQFLTDPVLHDIPEINAAQYYATIMLESPIPIRTQCFKHKVGFVENEMSRRYVQSDPKVFTPQWRSAPTDNVKQGSGDILEDQRTANAIYRDSTRIAQKAYSSLLHLNVAPEQARFVLPQGTTTTWVWTASIPDWQRFLNQRLKHDAQSEIRDLAAQVDSILTTHYGEILV